MSLISLSSLTSFERFFCIRMTAAELWDVEIHDWWPVRLARDGYSLDVLAADGTQRSI